MKLLRTLIVLVLPFLTLLLTMIGPHLVVQGAC